MTKEQILADLSVLPLSTLEKLQKYSQMLIVPDEDLLLNVTMSQMVDKSFQLADIHFPQWTDRSRSDFGRYIVELVALFSEKDFWYINALANESLLSKMTLYSTAFIRSIELGHTPIVTTSATCNFDVTFEAGNAYTYAAGALIIELPSSQLKFTNRQPFTVPANAFSQLVPLQLTEGNLITETFSYNGYRIDLRKPLIDLSTVTVRIENTEWTRVKVFGQSEPSSTHFMVLPEDSGKASIFFGEDGYGKTPDVSTTVEVSYFVSKGIAANGIIEIPVVNTQSSGRKVLLVSQTSVPAGGLFPESLASLKNTTLNYFTGKNVVNNASAVQKWLNNQPEVKKSMAIVIGNNVFIRVIPANGAVATTTLLNTLATRIDPYISGGYFAYGVPTQYISVSPITVEVYHLQGYDPANIISLTKQLISDYTNPLILAEYGKSFSLSDVEFLLKSKVPGVQNVVFLNPTADVSVNMFQILNKTPISSINVTTVVV